MAEFTHEDVTVYALDADTERELIDAQNECADVLDAPRRVILDEVVPTQRIGFDGNKTRRATKNAFRAELE